MRTIYHISYYNIYIIILLYIILYIYVKKNHTILLLKMVMIFILRRKIDFF